MSNIKPFLILPVADINDAQRIGDGLKPVLGDDAFIIPVPPSTPLKAILAQVANDAAQGKFDNPQPQASGPSNEAILDALEDIDTAIKGLKDAFQAQSKESSVYGQRGNVVIN